MRRSTGDRSEYPDWSQRYSPDGAPLFVHNEVVVDATPGAVWDVLVDACRWRWWFGNAMFVRIRQPIGGRRLTEGTVFSWASYCFPLRSIVVRADAPAGGPLILGWDFEGWHLSGHHVWIISGYGPGARVVTEEVEIGLLPRILGVLLRPMLRVSHERWVNGLRREAQRRGAERAARAPVPGVS